MNSDQMENTVIRKCVMQTATLGCGRMRYNLFVNCIMVSVNIINNSAYIIGQLTFLPWYTFVL